MTINTLSKATEEMQAALQENTEKYWPQICCYAEFSNVGID